MDTRFSIRSFSSDHEDNTSSPESQPGSSTKETSTVLSRRKSRKAAQKRVVSIPIKNSEGTPSPSDSWAWRKYGQKPIKGSPYPRGYYKCSSSKGCPARKYVERSRDDPDMLVVTYSCEHNHPCPVRKNNHRHRDPPATATTTPEEENPDYTIVHSSPYPEPELELVHEEKSLELFLSGSPELDVADDSGWFTSMQTTRSTIFESPIYDPGYYQHHHNSSNNHWKSSIGVTDVSMFFPMREDDDSMFSDLGELPECTIVFTHGNNMKNDGVTQIC